MSRQGVPGFKYFVGIGSLDEIAAREDRVCVLNILGGESSDVTPVGHAYSGGNVVFGTSPGRRGQVLRTRIGPIPVFNNVREGLDAGHRFNCGVVYTPPSGARDGVAELIRVNPGLRKVFIVTEKLSVRDSREIRAMGQQSRIDIFGGNSLGVADAWNQVRIGGALGGDAPAESLRKGSVAIFSNSGNFTTTIAAYLRMGGWGTTTLISSGKDVYIHYAAPEFAAAFGNDGRSKAAVLYVEPGGSYELDAAFTKPVVACVVGRWKSKLSRPVGHAGAVVGLDDDALAKEGWFMAKFGVGSIFTPENPVVSARGAVVTNIAHIPLALTTVMRANGYAPDFDPEGNLALKPWFASNQGLALPARLDLPAVEAVQPYGEQIGQLNRQIGAVLPRRAMKDASGASRMDAATQITSLHGTSMLDAALLPIEANICLALLGEPGGSNEHALVSAAVAVEVNLFGAPALAAAEAARDAGNSPNTVMATACGLVGPRCQDGARKAMRALLDQFAEAGLTDPLDTDFEIGRVAGPGHPLVATEPDRKADALLLGLEARGGTSVFLRYLRSLAGHPTPDAVLGAIAATLAWAPLQRKRISLLTAETIPWWLRLFGVSIGASAAADRHAPDAFCGMTGDEMAGSRSLGEIGFAALIGKLPGPADLFVFQTLAGLLLSNGPGTISAQGAKGAVSADGPEAPERVQLNKALMGFLTHSGYAHGGNGYEGIAFLISQFEGTGLADPGDPAHGLDLAAMARRYALDYATYKAGRKTAGSLSIAKVPGVNHPVFKGQAVNLDPREVFVGDLFARRGEYNVFHDYYRHLVRELHGAGLSPNVYCVNVDAVIAALLLKMIWQPYRQGHVGESAIETSAFTVFLYARMIGCAAEIIDHLNRGRDMDTRTPASSCQYVS